MVDSAIALLKQSLDGIVNQTDLYDNVQTDVIIGLKLALFVLQETTQIVTFITSLILQWTLGLTATNANNAISYYLWYWVPSYL